MPKEPRKSELLGVYETLKQGDKLPEVAEKTGYKTGTIKSMFLGHKRIKPSVYETAVNIADSYLAHLEALNQKAKLINKKYEEIKTTQ